MIKKLAGYSVTTVTILMMMLFSFFPSNIKVYAAMPTGEYDTANGWYIYSEYEDHIEIESFHEWLHTRESFHETVPSSINGKPVTVIQDEAFVAACYLSSVFIPDSVTTLGVSVFVSCERLATVRLSSNITELPSGTFANCYSLKSITNMTNNLTAIRGCAISSLKNLQDFSIPKSVTIIEDYPAASDTWLNKYRDSQGFVIINGFLLNGKACTGDVIIPDTVHTIGDFAFHGNDNIRSVTIPNTVTSIEEYAFDGCENLSNVSLPDSITEIEDCTFYNCESLKTIDIPDSVLKIEDRAFDYSGLTSIEIPSSVNYIGRSSFYCRYLETVTIKNKLCNIYDDKETFYSGTTIRSYADSTAQYYAEKYSRNFEVIPDDGNCNYTGNYDFSTDKFRFYLNCADKTAILTSCLDTSADISVPSYLKDGYIPGIGKLDDYKVISIGDGAFKTKTSMITIEIPETIESIGEKTFLNCTKLEKIEIPESVNSIGSNSFTNCSKLKEIYIYNPDCNIANLGTSPYNDLIIYGYNNSSAEKYANDNDISFVSLGDYLSKGNLIPGDINDDGEFSISDVVMLQNWLLTEETTLPNWQAADLCEDGILDAYDLCLLKKMLLNSAC